MTTDSFQRAASRMHITAVMRDRPARVAVVSILSLVIIVFVSPLLPAILLILFLLSEAAMMAMEGSLVHTDHPRRYAVHFVLSVAVVAEVSGLSALMIAQGDTVPLIIGMGFLWSTLLHCLTVRTWEARFYVVSVLPVAAAFLALLPLLIAADPSAIEWFAIALSTVLMTVYLTLNTQNIFRQHHDLLRAQLEAVHAEGVKDRFIASISHEVRTPLTGILGIAQIMADDAVDPATHRRADLLLAAGGLLKSILDDVLDQAKLRAGGFTAHPVPSDPREVIHATLTLFGDAARAKGLALRHDIAPDIPVRLSLDPLRIRQIVSNLLSNAIKHTPSGSVIVQVTQDAATSPPTLRIAVADTGTGIAAPDLARLFDVFTQLDDAAAQQGLGSGLGLSIARDLARLMGGDITVASTVGAGTTFTVAIPAAICAVPADVAPCALNDLHILVADDNATNRLIVSSFLTKLGATSEVVADGAMALAAIARTPFDAVLMDIQMPVLDGIATVAALRADPRQAALPVIALTATGSVADAQRYAQLGFDGYLSKPVNRVAMAQEILRCVADAGAARVAAQ